MLIEVSRATADGSKASLVNTGGVTVEAGVTEFGLWVISGSLPHGSTQLLARIRWYHL